MAPPRLGRPPQGPLPEVTFLPWDGALFRIQNAETLVYKRYPGPRHRFDAPAGQYATIYANDSRIGVFAEVYVDAGRRLGAEDENRHLVEIVPQSPLPVIDLLSEDTLRDLKLDERISTGEDYERCQEWALKLYDEWPEVYGIRYGARCAGRSTANVALFAERCADSFEVRSLGRLGNLEETVLEAADRYGLRASFLA